MMKIIQPTLVIDKEICLRNIDRMVRKAKDHELHFRPHFKTHQSAHIGEWFRTFNIQSITVSSVMMADYFARNGWNDITIAFPVNLLEIKHINDLAARIKLNVLVENQEAAKALSKKITNPLGVFAEIDTGDNRTGISNSQTDIIDSILKILSANGKIMFKGFLSHNGKTYTARSTNEIFSWHFGALLKLRALKQRYKSKYPELEISIGDTPSCSLCINFSGVDEIRPGNFIFYDWMQLKLGVCNYDDIAVKMLCPVVSKQPSRNEIVIYGGAIHLSKESLLNIDGKPFFGRIALTKKGEHQLLSERNYVARLSQEHGVIKMSRKNLGLIHVGDLVEIIPIHSCLTANLARKYYATDGKEIPMINT